MLRLGRVDFELTLTLCRWEWGPCAECYVPARLTRRRQLVSPSSLPSSLSAPLLQGQHLALQDVIRPPPFLVGIIYLPAALGKEVSSLGVFWKVRPHNFLKTHIFFSLGKLSDKERHSLVSIPLYGEHVGFSLARCTRGSWRSARTRVRSTRRRRLLGEAHPWKSWSHILNMSNRNVWSARTRFLIRRMRVCLQGAFLFEVKCYMNLEY